MKLSPCSSLDTTANTENARQSFIAFILVRFLVVVERFTPSPYPDIRNSTQMTQI
jgi:hypothetical protein